MNLNNYQPHNQVSELSGPDQFDVVLDRMIETQLQTALEKFRKEGRNDYIEYQNWAKLHPFFVLYGIESERKISQLGFDYLSK